MKIILFMIFIILIGCESTENTSNGLIINIVIPDDFFYENVKYKLIYSLKYSSGYDAQNVGVLTDKLPSMINLSDFNNQKDLTQTIHVNLSAESAYLLVIVNNRIIDLIEINSSTKLINLKPIIRFTEFKKIESNSINLIDSNNIVIGNQNIVNSSIIFEDNNNLLSINQSTIENSLINLNFANASVNLSNITFKSVLITNVKNTINLANSIEISSCVFTNKINSNFFFSVSNALLNIETSVITDIPSFLSVVNSESNINNFYSYNISETTFKFNNNSKIKLNNSFFENNNLCFETINADSLIIFNSIFGNNYRILKNIQTNIQMNDSHFTTANGTFILQDYDFNVNKVSITEINRSNLIFRSVNFIIELRDGVRTGNDIQITDSYFDFGVSNIDTKIRDANDTGVNTGGFVFIMNEKLNSLDITLE